MLASTVWLGACGDKAAPAASSAASAASTAASVVASAPASAPGGDTLRVGFITDMSGVYADIDGPGGAAAIEMAIEDVGGTLLGKKIELLKADHQHKTDIAATTAREWVDQQGVQAIFGGTNSAVALATSKLMAERQKPYFLNGAGASRITNEDCSPFTVQYAYDTVALARVAGKALMERGDKDWYFLTSDFAFGHSLEKDASEVVLANGGKVVGAVRAPLGASDFSSFLLQAQASKAQVLAFANGGGDFINSVKAANEFGVNKTMKMAGLIVFDPDVHAIGLKDAQGLIVAAPWYWDLNDESRKFGERFYAKFQRMPTYLQAGDYSAALTYFKAVKAVGSTDGAKIMEYLYKTPVNDMFAQNAIIRGDGRLMNDTYLFEVKKPEESTRPWDYYKQIKRVPAEEAYTKVADSKCPLLKK
ncbi:MAG: ABC transporter substrate-binding protein [Brachymonas sp.]|nr:ABC transporter substrate-binding protein [Brachymonas sp.]